MKPNLFAEEGDSLSVVALMQVSMSQIRTVKVTVRIEPNGLGEVGNGPVAVAFRVGVRVGHFAVVVYMPAPRIRVCIPWIEPDGLREVGDGLIVVAYHMVDEAPVGIRQR